MALFLLRSDCPLCGLAESGAIKPFAEVGSRRYHRCCGCDLVFLDPDQRPGLNEERAEYQLHNNDIDDAGYRRHLERLTEPLMAGVQDRARILDYGCGPQPSISALLAPQGYSVTDYDPLFRPIVLKGQFDVIALSETIEHIFEPGLALARLAQMLAPRGRVGIMTERRDEERPFERWHYIRERSHVAFYSDKSMAWIANHFGWRLTLHDARVALFEA